MFRPADFFDLDDLDDPEISSFLSCDYLWDAVAGISELSKQLHSGPSEILGRVEGAFVSSKNVYVDTSAIVEPTAFIGPNCYVGPGAVVRHGAYLRSDVVMLRGSLIGHSSEARNALLLPDASAPFFAYIGDSILGRGVNLGSGTVLSNLPVTSVKDEVTGARTHIQIEHDGSVWDTGLPKFGAVLGDWCETGCNSVLHPGAIVGPRSLIYPLTSVRKGVYPAGSILKLRQDIEAVERT